MKTPLGTEVDLGPGLIVLDGYPAPPPPKGAQQPPALFGPCLLWQWSPISATTEPLLAIFSLRVCRNGYLHPVKILTPGFDSLTPISL